MMTEARYVVCLVVFHQYISFLLCPNKQTNKQTNQNYFFWMFESHNSPDTDPVVLWLTGGPGCASTLALVTENGPCKVSEDGQSTIPNVYGWNNNATVIWLDQPSGVGYSYGEENDKNEDMVGEDAYFFLQSFFNAHPEYSSSPFYVFGESFGGHYAPGIAHTIFEKNNELKMSNRITENIVINLAGVGIGNGLTDPVNQYAAYPAMAMNNSYGIKTVSDETYTKMVNNLPKCLSLAEKCQTNPAACSTAYYSCSIWELSPYEATGLNVYDIRIPCEVPGLCYNFTNTEIYFNLPSTLEALHVRTDEAATWTECNYDVNGDFSKDFMVGYEGYVADLLEGGIPVMIYAGDADYVCNWIGNKAWTMALDWSGHDDFNAVEDSNWEDMGMVRSANGFTFLQVYGAGHLVPMDQPLAALTLLNTFTSGGF
jgi:cathepsin A (carboxypeptidase C)